MDKSRGVTSLVYLVGNGSTALESPSVWGGYAFWEVTRKESSKRLGCASGARGICIRRCGRFDGNGLLVKVRNGQRSRKDFRIQRLKYYTNSALNSYAQTTASSACHLLQTPAGRISRRDLEEVTHSYEIRPTSLPVFRCTFQSIFLYSQINQRQPFTFVVV